MDQAIVDEVRAAVIVPRRGLVLAAALMAIFMPAVESSIVATALPTIIGDLGGFHLFSWVFAVPLLTQAIEKDGDTPLYHYHLGMAYAKQGEDSRAIASLKRALTLDAKFDGADEARRVVAELQVP